MSRLLNILVNITLFRAGPQDLPASWPLTYMACLAYLATGMLTSAYLGGGEDALRSVISIGMQFFVIFALLKWRKHAERLEQTLLAASGTGVLVGLLAFVFLAQADPAVQQPFMFLVWFSIFVWSLAVDANIYRQAFSVNLSQGVLITVLLMAASYVAGELLFNPAL